MRRWLQDLSYRLQDFMQGRYGRDPLSSVLHIITIVLLVLSLIRPLHFLWYIGLVVLIYSIFRMLSKNHAAREKELQAYYKIRSQITGKIKLFRSMWRDRNTHVYLKCPNCKSYIRLRKPPKGKNIRITCPKCANTFEKRT